MRLLVVRHAIAEDREVFAATGREDALRPLTADGRRKMKRAARGLRELVPAIDALVSSPFTRANETAEIVREQYELDRVETAMQLEPNTTLDDVVAWLGGFDQSLVAIVGHEPHLSRLVTYLIGGGDRSAVELKKGGVCLLAFEDRVKPGEGQLVAAVPPRVLRGLAG